MRKKALILSVCLALALGACRSEPDVRIVEPPEGDGTSAEGSENTWKTFQPDPVTDPETTPKFIDSDDAEKAPTLTLGTFEGRRQRIRMGNPGEVTIVVFWSMDIAATKAAAVHVRDLVRKYHRLGVSAVGVVEKSRTYRFAPRFMAAQSITYPVFYDNFKALERMGDAADVDVEKSVPSFFIVDRRRRVRFFKRGFSFTGATPAYGGLEAERIIENAAPDQHIEDYLRRILGEPRE